MDTERAIIKTEMNDCEQELARIEIQADAAVTQIRLKINPNADSVTDLATGEALVLLKGLHKEKERAEFLKKKIKKYQEQLYG